MALAYLSLDMFQKVDAGREKILAPLECHKTMKIERPVLLSWVIPPRWPFELAHAIATGLSDDRIDSRPLRSGGSWVVGIQVLQDLKLLRNIPLITHEE